MNISGIYLLSELLVEDCLLMTCSLQHLHRQRLRNRKPLPARIADNLYIITVIEIVVTVRADEVVKSSGHNSASQAHKLE